MPVLCTRFRVLHSATATTEPASPTRWTSDQIGDLTGRRAPSSPGRREDPERRHLHLGYRAPVDALKTLAFPTAGRSKPMPVFSRVLPTVRPTEVEADHLRLPRPRSP